MSEGPENERPYPGLLLSTGILTLLGLISAVLFLLEYTPLSLALFSLGGQLFFALAILSYICLVLRDLKKSRVL